MGAAGQIILMASDLHRRLVGSDMFAIPESHPPRRHSGERDMALWRKIRHANEARVWTANCKNSSRRACRMVLEVSWMRPPGSWNSEGEDLRDPFLILKASRNPRKPPHPLPPAPQLNIWV